MSGNSGNPPGNSRNSRDSSNSGNYDYPPASLPRPPNIFDENPSNQQNPFFLDRNSSPQRRLLEQIIETRRVEGEVRLRAELDRIATEPQPPPPMWFNFENLDEDLEDFEAFFQENRRAPTSTRPSNREGLHYLRSLLQSENSRFSAEETSRALETLDQELGEFDAFTSGWDSSRRPGGTRSESTASFSIPRPPPVESVPSRSTRRALWDSQQTGSGSGTDNNLNTNSDPSRPTTTYRSLRRRTVRPDLRSASNLTDPVSFPPLMPQSASSSSGRDSQGRLKRRKLDADDNSEGLRGFNYGHKGQVVPGPLKMEILSCDGGTFDPEGDSGFPENVLLNDQSVYCTKSSRCNIVLRHRGEAPFCLRKLVIKAPRTGFDSPIQEGMVFVSMAADDMLARTTQYQIQYSHTRRRRRYRRSGLQPSQEYFNSYQAPVQPSEQGSLTAPATNSSSELVPSGLDGSAPQSHIRLTIDYDENSDDQSFANHDDDEGPSVMELETVAEDEDECLESSDSTSDDEDLDDSTTGSVYRRRVELQRQQRRRLASLVNPLPHPSSTSSTAGAESSSNGEIMKPHARFFIEREKSMVSIRFDPPLSGRYILIKLWSPRSDGNIDIQSIIAHGFAGPRFFPSGGLR
ncbi:hypothetical protein N7539_009425 [Penicillium diatomitis]|uniref:Uncharacterized protein n=1 Tax=Penicillium diatomitis TaxID=2819901 RepID=A0A9W9WKN0_9EURO|nr:uncharacterized protein N7539_009425 [Penicillium diatomitis]KAJ5466696.1 hypothetical protein N7539_009425 [Penicillium diatomitis]